MTSHNSNDGSQPVHMSLMQQLIIASLVLAVGVLFGMAPVLTILRQPAPAELVAGISESAAFRHQRIAEQLQGVINPSFDHQGDMFVPQTRNPGQFYAWQLVYAQLAEREGLAPSEQQMNRWFDAWQQRTIPGSRNTTYGAALAQAARRRQGLDAASVRDFLRIQVAAEAYQERHITPPLAPMVLMNDLANSMRQQVTVAQIILDSAYLVDETVLAEVDDEAALNDLYFSLRERWFRRPATRTLTVFAADSGHIAERLRISDETLEERYEALRESRFTSRLENEDGEEEVHIVPFEEARAELREEITNEAAAQLASQLSLRFREALIEAGLTGGSSLSLEDLTPIAADIGLDTEDDPRLDGRVGIQITDALVVSQPQQGTQAQLGDFGMLDLAELNIFTDEHGPGFLSAPYRPLLAGGDRSQSHLFLLIQGAEAAGFQAFSQVRDEILRYHAARQVYQRLYTEAQDLRQRALEEGLEQVFEDPALRERWNAHSPTSSTLQAFEPLQPPAARLDDLPPEAIPAISLGAGTEHVQLTQPSRRSPERSLWDQRPRIRILELRDVEVADANPWLSYQARMMIQRSIGDQLGQAFQRDLSQSIESR